MRHYLGSLSFLPCGNAVRRPTAGKADGVDKLGSIHTRRSGELSGQAAEAQETASHEGSNPALKHPADTVQQPNCAKFANDGTCSMRRFRPMPPRRGRWASTRSETAPLSRSCAAQRQHYAPCPGGSTITG